MIVFLKNWLCGHSARNITRYLHSATWILIRNQSTIHYLKAWSLGKFVGPMQEMGMKFKIPGVVAGLETLRNLVF